MAITNFIPELWSASMLEAWNATNVWAGLTNREYEGILAKGNTVHITGVVPPTVKDYKAGVNGEARTTEADAISDTTIELVVDQEKSTDFFVDDIDRAQAAGSLAAYTTAAGYAMAEDTDKFLANLCVDGGTTLSGDTPTTGDDAFDLVRDARKVLNKANVPSDGRILVCNAEFEGLLLGADSKLTSASAVGDNPSQGLRNATIGQLLGCSVVTSNHLPAVDSPQFAMFSIRALAFVSQIDQVEAMRSQNKFADRLRALHVYGGKVIREEGIVVFGADGS
jgi:hypothetical protein